jgi:arylsulfatase
MRHIFVALLATVSLAAMPQALAAEKPNILFVLVDNLGYGELGVYGGGLTRGAPTPRIDKLATEGLRLTNMNMETQCTPSRSAILTGRYAIRSGTHSVPFGGVTDGLTQWEVTDGRITVGRGLCDGAARQVAPRQPGRTLAQRSGF